MERPRRGQVGEHDRAGQGAVPPAGHPNLSFRRMDATRLELPRAFDVAFSTAALHWVDDHEAVLGGVRRSLRPGGRLLFQMGGRGNVAEAWAVVDEVVARPRWRGYFAGFAPPYHFHNPEDYEAWLPRARFRVARAWQPRLVVLG